MFALSKKNNLKQNSRFLYTNGDSQKFDMYNNFNIKRLLTMR